MTSRAESASVAICEEMRGVAERAETSVLNRLMLNEAADLIDELVEALDSIVEHQDGGTGNAPGHGHIRPGIWDDDLGNQKVGRANLPCEWCATWNRAKTTLAKARGDQ